MTAIIVDKGACVRELNTKSPNAKSRGEGKLFSTDHDY